MDYNEAKKYLYEGDLNNPPDSELVNKLLCSVADDDIHQGLKLIQEITKCDDTTAKILWVDCKCDYGTTETNPYVETTDIRKEQNSITQPKPNIPKCPTCGSVNIKKISTTERVGSVAMFGLFSKKINKSFKCNDCGYTW